MVQLCPKWQGSSSSHSKHGTHFCVGTAGTQLTSDCLLPQEGGGEWVAPDPRVIVVGLLCRSALALPEHTPVSGRLRGGRWPTGVHLTQVTREAASPHAYSWLYNQRKRLHFNEPVSFLITRVQLCSFVHLANGLRFSSKQILVSALAVAAKGTRPRAGGRFKAICFPPSEVFFCCVVFFFA